jgi:hypothetical protein
VHTRTISICYTNSNVKKRSDTLIGIVGIIGFFAFVFVLANLTHTPATPKVTPGRPAVAGTPGPNQPVGQFFANGNRPFALPRNFGATTPAPVPAPTPLLVGNRQQQVTLKPLSNLSPKKDSNTNTITRDLAAKILTVGDKQYPLRTYAAMSAPNDPGALQPWLTSTNLSQAWDTPAGNHDTLLAVIDTGFALKHEEFANRWYANPGESGTATSEAPSALNCTDRGLPISASCNLIDDDADGIVDNETGPATYQNPSRLNCTDQGKPLTKDCNRIDDDGNGLVDDVTGWDFANNDNSPQAGELNPNGAGTRHGTETAGVAAATGNNNKGIAGVDWHTKILPIQALDDDSYGDTLGVGRAIRYAASQGADVISLSLGSSSPDDYVRESIKIAIAAGSIVVASSGNNPCDCMVYPAHYPEVVSVGALNGSNAPASFTSYGDNLDIMAPGTGITSPVWSSANPTGAYASGLQGTSFSAPIVAGLLTRLRSQQPTTTPLQLIAELTENTNRLTLPAGTSRTTQLGYGAVDAAKATTRAVSARNTAFLYGFTPVSKGAYLTPNAPLEVAANYIVQRCEDGQIGTTPLFELAKATNAFYTISQVEVWQAQNAGYQSRLFAEVCLQQPQDTTATIRQLNIFKEFGNLTACSDLLFLLHCQY